MKPEERSVTDEWAAKVKEASKELARIQWRLVRCVPEEEQWLLAELRTQADVCEALKAAQADFHRDRKGEYEAGARVQAEENRRKNSGSGVDKLEENNRKQAILSRLKHLSADDLEALVSVETAQVEVAKAQIKLAEYERLAIEGKKDKLVHLALTNQDLHKVYEGRRTKRVNDTLRSGGGVTRIESGEGK